MENKVQSTKSRGETGGADRAATRTSVARPPGPKALGTVDQPGRMD